jgi:hypothetical protein
MTVVVNVQVAAAEIWARETGPIGAKYPNLAMLGRCPDAMRYFARSVHNVQEALHSVCNHHLQCRSTKTYWTTCPKSQTGPDRMKRYVTMLCASKRAHQSVDDPGTIHIHNRKSGEGNTREAH